MHRHTGTSAHMNGPVVYIQPIHLHVRGASLCKAAVQTLCPSHSAHHPLHGKSLPTLLGDSLRTHGIRRTSSPPHTQFSPEQADNNYGQHSHADKHADSKEQQGFVLGNRGAEGAAVGPGHRQLAGSLRPLVPRREAAAGDDVPVDLDRALWVRVMLCGGEQAKVKGMAVLQVPHVEPSQVDAILVTSYRVGKWNK